MVIVVEVWNGIVIVGIIIFGVFVVNLRNNFFIVVLLMGWVVRIIFIFIVVKEGDIFFYIKEFRFDSIIWSII